jgi:hypothetical protein
MSWEHEWPLTVWPTRGEVERAIAATIEAAALQPPETFYEAFDEFSVVPPAGLPATTAEQQLAPRTIVTLLFRVPVASAVDVAVRLDPLGSRETYERTLKRPRHQEQLPESSSYTLSIDLVAPQEGAVDRLPPRVRIYSNEYDNREAYGILAVIAVDLADRLEKLSAFS